MAESQSTTTVDTFDFQPLFTEDEDTVKARLLDPFLLVEDPELQFSIREGGFLFDMITTIALEFARAYEALNQTAAVSFLTGASGDYLDQKGVELNRPRLAAAYATTSLTVNAANGTVIPAATRFSTTTSGDDDDPPIEFASTVAVTVGVSGVASVPVISTSPGANTNVPAQSITQMVDLVTGVIYVSNDYASTGGTDEETDNAYRSRLVSSLRASGGPGVREDYRDWAREISGVSDAVVFPHWDGGGTVKVVIMGPDLTVPTSAVLRTVQDYLDPSVAVLATMETDEAWTGVTFSTTKAEGSASVLITAPSNATSTAELIRDEHLDYIAANDRFSLWVNVNSSLANLTSIRFQVVDDVGLVSYKQFVPADLSSGEQYLEWTLSDMVVPTDFDWANLKKFQVVTTTTSSGAFSFNVDAWRVTDSDGGVGQGRAPIGAQVTVVAARLRPIYVQVQVVPAPGYSVASLQSAIEANLTAYFAVRRSTTGYLYLSEIANVVNDTPGVQTYYNVRLNNASDDPNLQQAGIAADLVLTAADVPVLSVLDLTT